MKGFKVLERHCSVILLILTLTGCDSGVPVVNTMDVINITSTSAISGGVVYDEGSGPVVSRGLVWSTDSVPTLISHAGITVEGYGHGVFTSEMNGLSPSTNYSVRAYAFNDAGNSYGLVHNFKTPGSGMMIPEIITTTPEVVATDSAQLGGLINNYYGTEITEKGVYWGYAPHPELTGTKIKAGSGPERYTVTIKSLFKDRTYYARAYINSTSGNYIGMQVSFKTRLTLTGDIAFNNTIPYGSVTDIEGNQYKTVQIGSQIWMAENLKTSHYNDGSTITNISDNSAWLSLTEPACCWYNNLAENKNLVGAHYNWYAVDTKMLCPTGWHVPTDNEWQELTDFLGGLDIAGAKLKESGLIHWEEPNAGATNSSGFTAIPAGQRRGIQGTFTGLGLYDSWWSSTEYNIYKAWYRSVAAINTNVWRSSGALKQTGTSIRCIKD